jgi:hypothetical protein
MTIRVDDWMKLGCGDQVTELEGRHVGRVEAIADYIVKIKWLDTGWISHLPRNEVVRVATYRQAQLERIQQC